MNRQHPYPTPESGKGRSLDSPRTYVFGEWEIDCARREVRVRGTPVPLGSRAFDIVEVLVQSGGELVSKDDLMSRVWSRAVVEDNTLQFHISAIRKALDVDRGMVKTVSGRGYRLLGEWTIREERAREGPDAPARLRAAARPFQTNIPVAASALIGRETAVQEVRDLLSAGRMVTLTGPGGIGKTVLAAEIARRLFPTLEADVVLVDLVSLADAKLVPSAVASLLGLQLGGDVISAETVARAIGGRRLLLVLDNCEHVIDEAAKLAECAMHTCPRVSILATSRELLRIEGEFVYPVPPLDLPPQPVQKSAEVLAHSAVQLFVARTKALRSSFSTQDGNLLTIAAICRRLDGIPLAIEFAATCAAALGVQQVSASLADRFALMTHGRRTALPRHQTLRATLEWSYKLLPEGERRLLRHLGIFPAGFTLEAAAAVMADGLPGIAAGIASLISKSLVALDGSATARRWRLLETVRVFALEELGESEERDQAARRHAAFFCDIFAAVAPATGSLAAAAVSDDGGCAREIDNVRAALDWCFSPSGDPTIGVALVVAAAPIFLMLSLVAECHRWSARAILALNDAGRGGPEEMHIQASLGTSLMHMHGQSEAARVALNRSLAIATELGDAPFQMGLLGMLHMFHLRGGDFRIALDCAKRGSAIADATQELAALAFARSMLGRSLHIMGNVIEARAALEASLDDWSRSRRTITTHLAADHPYRAGIALARTLWLQGYPAQALKRAHQAIEGAEQLGHTVSLMVVLAWAVSVFLWTGDLESAELHIDWSISHAESNSVAPFVAVGQCYKGALAIMRGDAESGVPHLQAWVEKIHATRYELLTTEFNTALAQGLAALDRFDEGMTLIEETIRLTEKNGDLTYMPELLRMKARLLASMPSRNPDEAEMFFRRALDLSRRLGTRAWELRTALDLAELLIARGNFQSARALLHPVLAQYDEGFDTTDVKAGTRLLSALG